MVLLIQTIRKPFGLVVMVVAALVVPIALVAVVAIAIVIEGVDVAWRRWR